MWPESVSRRQREEGAAAPASRGKAPLLPFLEPLSQLCEWQQGEMIRCPPQAHARTGQAKPCAFCAEKTGWDLPPCCLKAVMC